MVAESVLFKVGETDGGKGGEQRGTGEDCAVVDGIPDSHSSSVEMCDSIHISVFLDGVVVADDAFATIEVVWDTMGRCQYGEGMRKDRQRWSYSSEVRALL